MYEAICTLLLTMAAIHACASVAYCVYTRPAYTESHTG